MDELEAFLAEEMEDLEFVWHYRMAQERSGCLTVGDLREAMEGLEDSARVVIETPEFKREWEAFHQASDTVPLPHGTDPMYEATTELLLICPREGSDGIEA